MVRPKKKPAADAAVEAAAAKPAAKRASAKLPIQKVEEVYLQSGGEEWNISDCKERAVAAFVAQGHRPSTVKKLVVYLKPEEGKVYYVVNDGETGSFDL